MNKIVCGPYKYMPSTPSDDIMYFSTYLRPHARPDIGYIAPDFLTNIARLSLNPAAEAIDFATFAFSVLAADKAILRQNSADGWTRKIDLSVYLQAPKVWEQHSAEIQMTLRFLTGDLWSLHFLQADIFDFPTPRKIVPLESVESVCLLSGGMDSLIGAIDLFSSGRSPALVSQVVRGSAGSQREFSLALHGELQHCQWSGNIHVPGPSEQSTRSRSIVFLAFALLVASSISTASKSQVDVFVPENGYISLNIPLDPMRVGSFSTKTTHPIYLSGIQRIWQLLGINARLVQPYRFKTKGEMMLECKNKELFCDLAYLSISCGKYGRHKLTHCGTCIPCLVRRAAFLRAGIEDMTNKGYCIENVTATESRDVASAAYAYTQYRINGIRSVAANAVSFANGTDRSSYLSVIARGLDEIGAFLQKQGVI